jgi:integrase
VPLIRQLAERLNLHRELQGNPSSGLMFESPAKKPVNLDALARDVIRPALEKCGAEWHGWHAARRGLGSNLYRLGVPDMVIQRILRHANVSTTATYYIKTAADDVREAMARLESSIPSAIQAPETLTDTFGTPNLDSAAVPATVN